ncbi:MAG: methyltransferase domain-containing protein [Pseudomonadales bacterium]|nr:methyltransferase domain-containing protein [Pseudomonadales bacterium]
MDELPKTMAELGPGASLGIGLAAMLSGVDHYVALDVVAHSNRENNLKVLDELVEIFQARSPRRSKGWPDFDELLDERLFPSHILTNNVLERTLCKERVDSIRRAIMDPSYDADVSIRYGVPDDASSHREGIIERESIDFVVSHSVLEHVAALDQIYGVLRSWLKPGGMMSHQIDYTGHGVSSTWNGYRSYSEYFWKLLVGKRAFLINREPHSVHVGLIKQSGFSVRRELCSYRVDGMPRHRLARRWQAISDEDLSCAGAFLQAVKR